MHFHLMGKFLWKWANRLNTYDSERKRTSGAGLPHPGAIYMYITIIFKDLFLFSETAWPIKAKRLVEYS